jgi:acylphosphatase
MAKIVQKEVSELGNIKIVIASNWDEIDEIKHWCKEHQCGKKISLRQFAFKREEELTMFQLRWKL